MKEAINDICTILSDGLSFISFCAERVEDCHINSLEHRLDSLYYNSIMLPRELLESLNLHDDKDIKMAENLWKMLDQMADSNPQDYQNFISKNLK